MSRKLDYAEMKQIMEQYFLLLSGKRAMKGNLNMAGFDIVNFNISQLAGIISDTQHGTKTSIPNSHHNKLHQATHLRLQPDEFNHIHKLFQLTAYSAGEVNLSSATYTELIALPAFAPTEGMTWFPMIFFNTNIKCDGTLIGRGADFKLTREDALWEDPVYEWSYHNTIPDWKGWNLCCVDYLGEPVGWGKYRLYWRCQDTSYTIFSKVRHFFMINNYVLSTPY